MYVDRIVHHRSYKSLLGERAYAEDEVQHIVDDQPAESRQRRARGHEHGEEGP